MTSNSSFYNSERVGHHLPKNYRLSHNFVEQKPREKQLLPLVRQENDDSDFEHEKNKIYKFCWQLAKDGIVPERYAKESITYEELK